MQIWENREKPDGLVLTSDHVEVSNQFIFTDPKKNLTITLIGETFNMLNQCHSAEKHSFTNNPENWDESSEAYLTRKSMQFDNIISKIKNNAFDFLFLQEVDFLTRTKISNITNTLKHNLAKNNYELVYKKPDKTHKLQAIIYNSTIFEFHSLRTLIAETNNANNSNNKNQYDTLLEATLTHIDSKQKIILTSVHLDFKINYSDELFNYTKIMSEKENAIVIWGGDANHPSSQITGHSCDPSRATGYFIDSQSRPTIYHENTDLVKSYDGFGASAPLNYDVKIIEQAGLQFTINNNTIGVTCFK